MLKQVMCWSVVSLLVILILPLIPYAISALSEGRAQTAHPIQVPNPGADLWRDVRQRNKPTEGVSQIRGVDNGILINQYGDQWRQFRMDILVPYGAYLIGGILAFIVLFFLFRGTLRLEEGRSGVRILRFTISERLIHWFTVSLFWLLALTGLILLYGRFVLIPLLGPEGFSITASACKEAHNLFGPMFLFAILLLFVAFFKNNFYAKGDMKWLTKGGGLIGGHASAGRFNAGEKIWFWLACILGIALSASGLVLDFALLGQGREIMEGAHVVHGVAAVIFIAVSFGHIYLGTLGMEGSLESMTTGYVDANWAKAHHDRWYEEMQARPGNENRQNTVAGGVAATAKASPVSDS